MNLSPGHGCVCQSHLVFQVVEAYELNMHHSGWDIYGFISHHCGHIKKNSLIMCEDITGPEDVTITQFTQLSNHQVSNMRHCMISGASPDCSISTLGGRHDLLWLFDICLR